MFGFDRENWLHVVAAVIENQQGDILIAKRPSNKHQGGLWEFPGGKVEPDENAFSALKRELREELAIEIQSSRPFLQVHHHYTDKSIFLDTYKVDGFSGKAKGNEGQEIRWIHPKEIVNFEFPKANVKIVKALKSPEMLSITNPNFDYSMCLSEEMEAKVQQIKNLSVDALLLRLPLLNDEEYIKCFLHISSLIDKSPSSKKTNLFCNRVHLYKALQNCTGFALHLSANELIKCIERPVPSSVLCSAACHNEAELSQAEKIACDFVLVSPVRETNTHRNIQALGWSQFKDLLEKTELPVLALGGMQIKDLAVAKEHGALGLAGISNFGMGLN